VKHDIRRIPLDEIREVKLYRNLMPDPSEEDFERLYEAIKANGLDPSHPLVVNEDQMLLDGYTRYGIAKLLGLDWVWVVTKNPGDRWAEREFVIKANLARRQLTTAQRADLGLKLLEIEQERARERQRKAGLQHKSNLQNQGNNKENQDDKDTSRLVQTFAQAEESDQGRAIEIAAQQVNVSRETLRKASRIQQAAQENLEVAEKWEDAKSGRCSLNRAYQEVVKSRPQKKNYADELGLLTFRAPQPEPEPEPPQDWFTEEELYELLLDTAEKCGISRASLAAVVELLPYSEIMFIWENILRDELIPEIGWSYICTRVRLYEQEQIAKLESEKPLPEGAESVGPWVLDRVHQASLAELEESFPEETAHLVFTDAQGRPPGDIEAVGRLARRILVPGKMLCVYITPAQLPFALQSFGESGLTYCWTCSVSRPRLPDYDPRLHEMALSKKWWMMLLFRKPAREIRQFAVLEDSDDGEKWTASPEKEREWYGDDALATRRMYVREMPRQAVECFTLPGQLVVDPFTGDGVLGMVAIENRRRFLLFDAEPSRIKAKNFRFKQEMEWKDNYGQPRH